MWRWEPPALHAAKCNERRVGAAGRGGCVAGGSKGTVQHLAHREGVPVEDDVLDELLIAPPHLGRVARREAHTSHVMRP